MTEPADTIDPAEIAKFSALAAQWWDPDGPFRALHLMNPVRINFIIEHAAPLGGQSGRAKLAGLKAIDIGCGGGLATMPLKRLGADIEGLDASQEAIGAARAQAAMAGLDIDFRCGAIEDIAKEDARYDLVVALEILEHVADPAHFLQCAQDILAPGGALIISTINRTQKARALALFAAEKVLQWAPEGAHEYDKLITPDEVRAHAHDLSWDSPVGISFNPLRQGWSSSSDISMNYMMAGRKSF